MTSKVLTVQRLKFFTSIVRYLGPAKALHLFINYVSKKYGFFRDKKYLNKIIISSREECVAYIRPGTTDLTIFNEIFIERVYDTAAFAQGHLLRGVYKTMLSLNEIPIILDLGANTGLSAIFFAKQFPEATVIAVEPEAENYKLLEKNCLGYTNIETVHAAISEEAGRRVSLMRPGSGEWSWQTREDDLGPIPTTSINELLSRIADGRLLIVKIDIEGSETELFQSNTDWVPKAALVIFEPHDWLFNWRGTADAVFSSLTRTPRDYRFKGENIFAFSHDLIKPRPTKYPTNETEAPAPEVKK